VDPERLAALLDGRLDARQRADVLARLAASNEALDVFVDATDALHADAPARVRPLARGRPPLAEPPTRRWLAAAVLLAVALPSAILLSRRASERDDAARLIVTVSAEAHELPDGWNGHPWTVTRGLANRVTPLARASRLGAHLVDLELAVRARDSVAASLAADIVVLLESTPGAGPVAAIYHELERRAGEAPELLAPLVAQGRMAVPPLAGEAGVAVGAWTEAGRIAAARHDTAFFRTRTSHAALDRLQESRQLPAPVQAAAARVGAALPTGGRRVDWPVVERELAEVLRALGS
jgi:hypothetical protein